VLIKSKKVRGFLTRVIEPLGVDVTERTAQDLLQDLVRSLHPLECDRDLIRIGPTGDGGYLLPDDLDDIRYAFSPGVSDESGFEADLASRGVQVFLADQSVDGPAEENANFVFDKKFVGSFTDDNFMTLDDWKSRHIGDYSGDLLLQMDIEGFEYETLLATSAALMQQFRIIVLEVHFLEQLLCRPWFDLVSRVFRKLLSTHSVVHSHPNNCCGSVRSRGIELPRIMEMSFYRNDRISSRRYATRFPHPLDAENTLKAPLLLPHSWYRGCS
jgi:hypothetical protein